jgi:hypothetical protein
VETWLIGGLPVRLHPVRLDDAITVASDAAGHYAVESMREWHFFVPVPDAGPAWFPRLIVSHPGYASRVIDSWQRAWWENGLAPEPIILAPSDTSGAPTPCPTAKRADDLPPESREPHRNGNSR